MAFQPYAPQCAAIAATGVWYKTQGIPVGTMYPILESDMTFNSNLKWTATGEAGKLDFQSVVLHELGHTIGLGDLYGRAEFSTDTCQVMHYYTGVKRTLGNGDATGVWKLYG
jgi:predicted SprT family Zn-dependent metalloprotease